mmetsp:Transcript_45075/g.97907  ORF Transcript_45075/g.97907 Transcript_45075/m.97907 type:complete len:259 (-) Transcript_45075:455-1231(-)
MSVRGQHRRPAELLRQRRGTAEQVQEDNAEGPDVCRCGVVYLIGDDLRCGIGHRPPPPMLRHLDIHSLAEINELHEAVSGDYHVVRLQVKVRYSCFVATLDCPSQLREDRTHHRNTGWPILLKASAEGLPLRKLADDIEIVTTVEQTSKAYNAGVFHLLHQAAFFEDAADNKGIASKLLWNDLHRLDLSCGRVQGPVGFALDAKSLAVAEELQEFVLAGPLPGHLAELEVLRREAREDERHVRPEARASLRLPITIAG